MYMRAFVYVLPKKQAYEYVYLPYDACIYKSIQADKKPIKKHKIRSNQQTKSNTNLKSNRQRIETYTHLQTTHMDTSNGLCGKRVSKCHILRGDPYATSDIANVLRARAPCRTIVPILFGFAQNRSIFFGLSLLSSQLSYLICLKQYTYMYIYIYYIVKTKVLCIQTHNTPANPVLCLRCQQSSYFHLHVREVCVNYVHSYFVVCGYVCVWLCNVCIDFASILFLVEMHSSCWSKSKLQRERLSHWLELGKGNNHLRTHNATSVCMQISQRQSTMQSIERNQDTQHNPPPPRKTLHLANIVESVREWRLQLQKQPPNSNFHVRTHEKAGTCVCARERGLERERVSLSASLYMGCRVCIVTFRNLQCTISRTVLSLTHASTSLLTHSLSPSLSFCFSLFLSLFLCVSLTHNLKYTYSLPGLTLSRVENAIDMFLYHAI